MRTLGILLLLQLIPVPMDHPQAKTNAEVKPLPMQRTVERVSEYDRDVLVI